MTAETTKATEHIGAGETDELHPVRFVVQWEIAEHWAEAKVFEASYSAAGLEEAKLEPVEDGDSPEFTVTFKWDGCANWDFAPTGCMLHTCGRSDVQAVAEVMLYLHKRAHELIVASDGGE